MTRFARAKGSKSSNERAPEDSTPWEVMKEQLMQSKKEKEESSQRQEAENQRIANYENFLKEHKVSKRKATWCDFPEETAVKKRLLPPKQPSQDSTSANGDVKLSETTSQENKKKKKKKKDKKLLVDQSSEPITEAKQAETLPETGIPQGKKQKNKKNKTPPSIQSSEHSSAPMQSKALSEAETQQPGKKHKKKNKMQQKASNSIENIAETENTVELNADHKPTPNKGKSGPFKENDNSIKQKKKGKMANGKPVRRKEINDKSFQLIINTKEVELVKFDGFPIMKKDAERLTELRKSMIQKGIPKSEVQRTMKLERRRAEKALARLKREVCYNCRKGGHNLSDCPELKSKIPGVDAAEGICFKCGSTEHRQFECKVQRDNEFRFATCFICREQGHLARQCPDNPKGLYPNGGSCKLCGDVTHLRKDCPTTQGQREETSLKLSTLESTDNIEDIGQQVKVNNSAEPAKKQPKKIKF